MSDSAASRPPAEKVRLGGMALRNGLLVHGPAHWAAAVRTPGGELKVASGRKPEIAPATAGRVPGVRGVAKLAEAFALIPIVKRALPEAQLPMQDGRTLGAMAGAAAAGRALRAAGSRTVARELAVAGVSLFPALLALRGGDLASYHGVEHKGSVAVAVEVFAWSERHPDSRLARVLRRPGHEIQRTVGTREPTPEQLEVGRAALDEILRLEGSARAS